IVCASCPHLVSAADLGSYLQNLPRPRVLYHMSDEYLKAGAELYQHCELVIRNGSALFSGSENNEFMQLPLGYSVGFQNPGGMGLPATRRQYSLAFLGKMKHDRKAEMLPALQIVPGEQYLRETLNWAEALRNFNQASTSIYRQAVFVPCPKGNWNPECNRLYDALEWGCIPLLRNYTETPYQDGYHSKLLGPHPLPEFDYWDDAASFASEMLQCPERLNALQAEVFGWWQDYKLRLKKSVEQRLDRLIQNHSRPLNGTKRK
ncbi:MAG TPA: hypothetical protein VJN01_05295, partial [Xanthomonadales bacterium]|nr:hypothetical protein [Xanthomonadales bacterium]